MSESMRRGRSQGRAMYESQSDSEDDVSFLDEQEDR